MKLSIIPNKINLPFQDWRRNVYSQSGEDGIVEKIFHIIQRNSGYFVEFGAWDGRHLSNSAKLVDEGWAGCFIEGDPDRFEDLQRHHKDNSRLSLVNAFVATHGCNSLDDLLDRAQAPKSFDFLSIDIDGQDFHVWKSLQSHVPDLVVIEFNPTIPAHVIYVQEDDPSLNRGCSLTALVELGTEKGYGLVAATEWNAFFLRRELVEAHQVPTYTPAEVKSTEYEAAIFHGFDGTLLVAGHRQLVWHGVSYGADELQVLPEDLRRIPVGQAPAFFERFQRFKNGR
jgi:hypothetical protein